MATFESVSTPSSVESYLPRPVSLDDAPAWITMRELVARFMEHARSYYQQDGKPTGHHKSMACMLEHVLAVHADLPVDRFTPLRAKEVRQRMMDGDHTRTYINRVIKCIRQVCKWGIENEIVPPNILYGLQAISPLKYGRYGLRETTPVTAPPDEVIQRFIDAAPPVIAAMAKLQWLVAMRPGEVCIMRWEDIDESGETWLYRPMKHKTMHHGVKRAIPLGPQCQAILEDWRGREPFIFSPIENDERLRLYGNPNRKYQGLTIAQAATIKFLLPTTNNCELGRRYQVSETCIRKIREGRTWAKVEPRDPEVFKRDINWSDVKARRSQRLGYRYLRNGYAQAFRRISKRLGINPPLRPNQLRHSAATRIRNEHGLEVAQLLLGHTTARMTETYAKPKPEKLMATMKEIG